jgi:hypothetical protein
LWRQRIQPALQALQLSDWQKMQEPPRKSRSTSESGYASGTLEDGREALLNDLHPIPEVDVNDLFNAVLAKNSSHVANEVSLTPAVSETTIAAVAKNLRGQKILTADNRWACFPQPPRNTDGNESSTFSKLSSLFDAIVDASPYAETNLLKLEVKGQVNPLPDGRPNSAPPDAYMILKSTLILKSKEIRKLKDCWTDIPVVMEVKRVNNDQNRHNVRLFTRAYPQP